MKSTFVLLGGSLLIGGGLAIGIAFRPHATEAATHADHTKGERRILYYVDPMHPAYKSDKPGVAPDCGMKLEPVYEGYEPAGQSGSLNISPAQQQLIGVDYGEATWSSMSKTFRAVGKVAQDETRVVRIHPKVEGWIEKVHADFTGARVEKGQPLLTIYSPELLAAQQEYLLALQARDVLKNSPLKEVGDNNDALIRAARTRLELWDFGPAQMEELQKKGQPQRAVTLIAPVSGYVVARNAFPGQKVSPETELYAIVDLTRIWVVADVFETDAANVRVGQSAVIGLPYENGRGFMAHVSYIQPQVDPATRTLKVRLDAPNPGYQLKPDMFVDVEFQTASQRKLTVPAEAVLDSGMKKTVFVDHGDGHLESRQVETGERMDDRVEIVKGLKAGERIVISGNFLIDSESQLKEALKSSPVTHQHVSGEHQP